MGTLPVAPAGGVVMRISLVDTKTRLGMVCWLNSTSTSGSKFWPMICTGVPPASGPEPGTMALMVGGMPLTLSTYSKPRVSLPWAPPGLMTVTSTLPRLAGGRVAVSVVASATTTFGDTALPKRTAAPGTNWSPRTTTSRPPSMGPTRGITSATVGVGET